MRHTVRCTLTLEGHDVGLHKVTAVPLTVKRFLALYVPLFHLPNVPVRVTHCVHLRRPMRYTDTCIPQYLPVNGRMYIRRVWPREHKILSAVYLLLSCCCVVITTAATSGLGLRPFWLKPTLAWPIKIFRRCPRVFDRKHVRRAPTPSR